MTAMKIKAIFKLLKASCILLKCTLKYTTKYGILSKFFGRRGNKKKPPNKTRFVIIFTFPSLSA